MTEDPLDVLRDLGETELTPCCGVPRKLSLKRRIINKFRYLKPRRYIGRKILGQPYGGIGILVEVDLSYKSKEEVENFWEALKLFRKAGISFDTGMGCKFDMDLDWSLKGAVAKCKGCGYNSEANREQQNVRKIKEHFIRPCDKCGKDLDSSKGYWHRRYHFWERTKYYHTDCYKQNGVDIR